MKHGAVETPHLSPPPVSPVKWTARRKSDGKTTRVEARLWSDARDEAMRELGCGPGEVDVELDKEPIG